MATDLTSRTDQAQRSLELEQHLKKQQDYMQDVVQQLRQELKRRSDRDLEKEATIAQLQDTVEKEKQARKSLQEYVEDVQKALFHESPHPADMDVDKDNKISIDDIHGAKMLSVAQSASYMRQGPPPQVNFVSSLPEMATVPELPALPDSVRGVDRQFAVPGGQPSYVQQLLEQAPRVAPQQVQEQKVPVALPQVPSVPVAPMQVATVPVAPLSPVYQMGPVPGAISSGPDRAGLPNYGKPPAAFPTVSIRPREPPLFKGELNEDVHAWASSLRDYCHLLQTNHEQSVAYAATLLQGNARTWWDMYLTEHAGARPRTLEDLIDQMQKRFQSPMYERAARVQLWSINQRKDEHVHAFAARFQNLLQRLPYFDEEDMRERFICALNPALRMPVAQRDPPSLPEAIRIAEHLELLTVSYMGRGTGGSSSQQQQSSGRGRQQGGQHQQQQQQQNRGRGGGRRGGRRGREEEGSTGARCSAIAVALMDTMHLSAPCSSLIEIGALRPDRVGTSAVDIVDRAAVALDTARHGWPQ